MSFLQRETSLEPARPKVPCLIILLVGSLSNAALGQFDTLDKCPLQAKGFTGICIDSVATESRRVNWIDSPKNTNRFNFYVDGRVAYPPDLGCEFPFRCTTERSTPDTCFSEAGFMHGVYIVRDKKSRTWIEQRYEQGYIVEHIEYNGRTGLKRGRLEYLDSAWMTTDGIKVIMEQFDEKTGDPISRLSWVLKDGKWRWTR
jgi:hypothetical protein